MADNSLERDGQLSAVYYLLQSIGEEPNRDGLQDTPRRFVDFLNEFSPKKEEPRFTTFPTDTKELVVVRNLDVRSLCEHHLAPFVGKAYIGYYPNKIMAGLSKFQRALDYFANRLQNQERITEQLAKYLDEKLERPHGLIVLIEAEHTCMSVRGVKCHDASTSTLRTMGKFHDNYDAINMFLNLIKK